MSGSGLPRDRAKRSLILRANRLLSPPAAKPATQARRRAAVPAAAPSSTATLGRALRSQPGQHALSSPPSRPHSLPSTCIHLPSCHFDRSSPSLLFCLVCGRRAAERRNRGEATMRPASTSLITRCSVQNRPFLFCNLRVAFSTSPLFSKTSALPPVIFQIHLKKGTTHDPANR